MTVSSTWADQASDEPRREQSVGPKPILLTNTGAVPKMSLDISALAKLSGFIGACVIDRDTGMMLSSLGGEAELDLEMAGALSADIVRAQQASIDMLEQNETIEDVLVTVSDHYHLMRPLHDDPTIFIYVVLDRKRSNLAVARIKLKAAEAKVRV